MSTATFLMSKDEGKKPMNSNATPRRGPNVGSSKWHTVGSTAFANYWCDTRSLIAAFWRSTTWLQQSWRSERSSWTKTLFTDKFLFNNAIQHCAGRFRAAGLDAGNGGIAAFKRRHSVNSPRSSSSLEQSPF